MANGGPAAPLQSLLFFESAVRHLNFTQAASGLGTSQPSASALRRWKKISAWPCLPEPIAA